MTFTFTATTTYTIPASPAVQGAFVLANATSAPFTVTLPDATQNLGNVFIVMKSDSSTNVVTIGTTSSQTINGSTTLALAASQYTKAQVISNGTSWYQIG
jgi:hypothetical protein